MDLLTNAIESIRVGIADYQSDQRPRLLSAVRNIHAGILLLFKEKLRRISPKDSNNALMMAKVRPARVANGDVVFVGVGKNTVDVQQIRERFKALDINLDWERFDKVNVARNQVEHLYPQMSQNALQGLISNSFLVIRDFMSNELRRDPRLLLGESTWKEMLTVSEVYEAQRRECGALISQAKWPSEIVKRGIERMLCQDCGAGLWKPFEGPKGQTCIRCDGCGRTFSPEMYKLEAATAAVCADELDAFQEGRERQFRNCPACEGPAFSLEDKRCGICGYVPGAECVGCGKEIDREKDRVSPFCSDCAALQR